MSHAFDIGNMYKVYIRSLIIDNKNIHRSALESKILAGIDERKAYEQQFSLRFVFFNDAFIYVLTDTEYDTYIKSLPQFTLDLWSCITCVCNVRKIYTSNDLIYILHDMTYGDKYILTNDAFADLIEIISKNKLYDVPMRLILMKERNTYKVKYIELRRCND